MPYPQASVQIEGRVGVGQPQLGRGLWCRSSVGFSQGFSRGRAAYGVWPKGRGYTYPTHTPLPYPLPSLPMIGYPTPTMPYSTPTLPPTPYPATLTADSGARDARGIHFARTESMSPTRALPNHTRAFPNHTRALPI